MARQIILLVVFSALLEFASSIENKRETCRCRSESSKSESWIDIMDQENWVVDIASKSFFDSWTDAIFEKFGSKYPYQINDDIFGSKCYVSDYFTEYTTKGLILNERWILIQLGCKTEEWVQFYEKFLGPLFLGNRIKPNYSYCTSDEIVISNRRIGSVPNKIRNLYNYGGQSTVPFPEWFRLIELESPLKLDRENLQTSFQPGCLLREHKEAKRTVYRNLSSSHRGEIVYADVSDHPNNTLSENLIHLQSVRGNGAFEGGLRRNIPLHFEVEGQKFVVGLSSPLPDDFDFRHYVGENGFIPASMARYQSYSYLKKPKYPVALDFYRVSSYLDWIQSFVKEDLCLFEQQDDFSFSLMPHSNYTADRT